jgi:trimeric autotransporter adhesin
MRNFLVSFILVIASTYISTAQNWIPVSSGITGTDINTTWTLLSYDSVLFAGGWFNNAGGIDVNDMAQWNGTNWDSVGQGTNGFINAMTVYNGFLYAGGEFKSIGGIAANNIARWNGSSWMQVGSGITGGQYGVNSLAVYNGTLYAGGAFDSAGGIPTYAIARWNDTNWSALGSSEISAGDEDDGVLALTVYNGELYIGGDFVTTGGTNLAKWNGTNLSVVGLGTTGPVYSLAVYKGNLYVGGMISQAGTMAVNSIAIWNTVNWYTMDSGITGENGYASVNALTVYNNELYAGGFFDTVNGKLMNCIAKWDGNNWSSAGPGINVGGDIDAMAVFNNSLFVGGGFDSINGVYAKNIAMLTIPTSINEIKMINKVTVYPNPAGNFISVIMDHYTTGMYYSIYNQLGEMVEPGLLNSNNHTTINITNYSCGIYYLTVLYGKARYSTAFVKD